jgi:hypothetical protein
VVAAVRSVAVPDAKSGSAPDFARGHAVSVDGRAAAEIVDRLLDKNSGRLCSLR